MTEPYRTECRAVAEWLVALLAGEVEPEPAAQLNAHVAQCATCQAELASLRRTQQLAGALHLNSPVLDRYPEFLRRLAAEETAGMASTLAPRVQGVLPVQAELVAPLGAAAEAADARAGVAAVVPLFGRRVLWRSGFGQGFELAVVSAQGRELLRLSATSLARVAAVAAGFSVFAGLAMLGVFFALFPGGWPREGKPSDAVAPTAPAVAPPMESRAPVWVQSFSHPQSSLFVWRAGAQWQASWAHVSDAAPAAPLTLPPPLTSNGTANLPATAPAFAPLVGATDGKSFVLLQEAREAFFVWHLPLEARLDDAAAPGRFGIVGPLRLPGAGLMPALAWFGNRYWLASVQPSQTEPFITLRGLNRLGEPLAEPETLAAETENFDKVGWPCLASQGERGALFFFTEAGVLQGRTLAHTDGQIELGPRVRLATRQRARLTPLRAQAFRSATESGYWLLWGEVEPGGFDVRLARLTDDLTLVGLHTLVTATTDKVTFDWRLTAQGLALLWAESRDAAASRADVTEVQVWQRLFDLTGAPLTAPQPLKSRSASPVNVVAGAAFADAQGQRVVVAQRAANGALTLTLEPVPELAN